MTVGRESARDRNGLHDSPDAASGETSGAVVDDERRCISSKLSQQFLTLRQIFANRDRRGIAERHEAFLLAFAADEYRLIAPVDVFEVDADQLRVANAAAVKQFKDDAVALVKGRLLGHRPIKHR